MMATNHDDQLGEIYPTMLNELNCTFGVSFSSFHCCGRRGLWPSWFVAIVVCGRRGIGPIFMMRYDACGTEYGKPTTTKFNYIPLNNIYGIIIICKQKDPKPGNTTQYDSLCIVTFTKENKKV